MKKLLIPFIFLLVLTTFSIDSKAQCNDQLVNDCALNVGDNATYIKDFKAKLKGARKGSAPIATFSIVLNKGTHYRFTVCNALEYEGEAVLQLYDANNTMIGSTFDLAKGKDYKAFDFMARKTATYKVYISFKGGVVGCAVGIVSMVR
jgi:hypothetical protein